MTSKARIAVVPPRFGDDVIGGAEAVLRELAEGLAQRGWQVDALTTCARNHFTWENELPEGSSTLRGVTIRRFPTVPPWDLAGKHRLEAAIVAGARLDISEQQWWANAGMRVPALFHYILDHGEDYKAIIFAPYMFWTTYACAQLLPDRTVLMPCLHDEPFARLDLYAPLFDGSRDIWFLSEPERDLAARLFGLNRDHAVVGAAVHVPHEYDAQGFRSKYNISGRFILYAGRREGAKGWENLLDQLARINSRTELPFSLVTFGAGDVRPPDELSARVIDLGFLPEEDKHGAFAAADAYLQPSPLESFSRTIMEAWLAGTVVIANAGSEVVRWHCARSGAGLTYVDEAELQGCLEVAAEAPDAMRRLAERGREYVLANYTWPVVLDAVESRLAGMQ